MPIPKELSSEIAAPMMCAGVTVFSPLRTHGAGPGKKVGVVGIGGLGYVSAISVIQYADSLLTVTLLFSSQRRLARTRSSRSLTQIRRRSVIYP
jgi:alcohol dehydrogenase (NADP+)